MFASTLSESLTCCYNGLSLCWDWAPLLWGGGHTSFMCRFVRCDDGNWKGRLVRPKINHRVFTRFYFLCLVEPQEHPSMLQSKRDFIFQICNNNLFCIQIIHLRETQAIFILFFLGPFFKNKIKTKKNNSTKLTLETSQMFFCEREKKMFIFFIFVSHVCICIF